MSEIYYYSAETNSFYPEQLLHSYILAESLPLDMKKISIDIFLEYPQPKDGYVRMADNEGLPYWNPVAPSVFHKLINGEWVISEAAQTEKYRLEVEEINIQKKLRLQEITKEIELLERFTERLDEEEVKLQSLINESQEIYRYLNAFQ